MGSRIYIGNLPADIAERDVRDEVRFLSASWPGTVCLTNLPLLCAPQFERFGRVRTIWVARKPPGEQAARAGGRGGKGATTEPKGRSALVVCGPSV